jgi:mRNA interferase MazF
MKKGDIIFVPFPFTDLSGTKLRPAVVLINSRQDVVVAFITSQLKWKTETTIPIKSSEINGLKSDSFVRLDKITTLDKEIVVGRLGSLTEAEVEKMNKELIKILNINI